MFLERSQHPPAGARHHDDRGAGDRLGLFSYRRLNVDLWPKVEFPFCSITTEYPGASPEAVEREVTKKIEEEVNSVEGVKKITSSRTRASARSWSSSA